MYDRYSVRNQRQNIAIKPTENYLTLLLISHYNGLLSKEALHQN